MAKGTITFESRNTSSRATVHTTTPCTGSVLQPKGAEPFLALQWDDVDYEKDYRREVSAYLTRGSIRELQTKLAEALLTMDALTAEEGGTED